MLFSLNLLWLEKFSVLNKFLTFSESALNIIYYYRHNCDYFSIFIIKYVLTFFHFGLVSSFGLLEIEILGSGSGITWHIDITWYTYFRIKGFKKKLKLKKILIFLLWIKFFFLSFFSFFFFKVCRNWKKFLSFFLYSAVPEITPKL